MAKCLSYIEEARCLKVKAVVLATVGATQQYGQCSILQHRQDSLRSDVTNCSRPVTLLNNSEAVMGFGHVAERWKLHSGRGEKNTEW